MANLPTGTVTFLFTDIERSTSLWQAHPAAMPSTLARHHEILRQSIQAHQGYVFQIVGDAFCAAFSTASNALRAALAAQRALSGEPWGETGALRVRMALHTGAAEARAGDYTAGEYASGLTLSRTARLLSAGHGGQVLLSQTTRDLVERDTPEGVVLVDLGEHRLKDLQRPERVYQLVAGDLPTDFPPLKSLDSLPHNLPVQLTSFVGRESEVAEVKRLLTSARLLTLTGTGGTGKTRLSLAVATDLLDEFPDGVWFVELAPVADPDLIPQAIADALDVRESPGRPLKTVLMDYARSKQMLLILDNCEHLIDASARIVENFLRTCPQLKILASSREALGITGEIAYRLPSLSLPRSEDRGLATLNGGRRSDDALTTDHYPLPTILESGAVRLFVDRARAVQPHFELTEQNAAAVVRICERLDGIPLALELAAARVAFFSVDQIAARLNDRFRLLTGGSRTAMPRQQTLRAAIDWSYGLLCDDERALLRGLSVFAGGWSFEAAESVVSGQYSVDSKDNHTSALATIDVMEMLPRLVNKSLVILDEQGGQARYRMLETVRQYAREELVKAGEAPISHDRHLGYFLQLAKMADAQMQSHAMVKWLNILEVEHDNLRRALEWALESHPDDALALAALLAEFWERRTYPTEGRRWFEQALARIEALPPLQGGAERRRNEARAKVLLRLGRSILVQGEHRELGLEKLDQGIAVARALNDEGLLAYGLAVRGLGAILDGDWDTSEALTAQALEIAERSGDHAGLWFSLSMRAQSLIRSGRDLRRGQVMMQRVVQVSRERGLEIDSAGLHYGFGYIALAQGDYPEARARFVEALEFYQSVSDKQFENMARSALGDVARLEGKYTEAVKFYGDTLNLWVKMGHRGAIARLLECFAFIASGQGRQTNPPDLATLQRATRLLGAADALRHLSDSHMIPEEIREYDGELDALKEVLDNASFEAAWEEGHAMSMEQAITLARE